MAAVITIHVCPVVVRDYNPFRGTYGYRSSVVGCDRCVLFTHRLLLLL